MNIDKEKDVEKAIDGFTNLMSAFGWNITQEKKTDNNKLDEDIEKSIKHIEERIKYSDLRPEIVCNKKDIENVLSELERYKNVTYFEKLEDGKLYKIDKERADDLYKHGNGNWLYIQMWKRKEG